MSGPIIHQLVGYGRVSDRLTFEADIEPHLLSQVIEIVGPDEDDPDAVDAYALSDHQAEAIFQLLGRGRPASDLDYFLEACEAPREASTQTPRAAGARRA